MRILIVAATAREVAPLVANVTMGREDARITPGAYRGHAVDVIVAGVGMVATAAWCSRSLAHQPYDLALNVGVCGSFDPALPPGCVVHVAADRLPELGAEDGDAFLSAQDLGLIAGDEFPFSDGQLVNHAPPASAALLALPAVAGITVNTAHGRDASIAEVVARLRPQVESMEGAAFMYACLIAGVPFAQVRAVSNRVERRNRAAWTIGEAIENLGRTALGILDDL